MPNVTAAAHDPVQLRQQATARLNKDLPAAGRRGSHSEALAVLHQMAAAPETAGDALALLHELQVHQVELELQQEELQRSRVELESALRRQTSLVERAPVGYMTIDAQTELHEINLAGARLLGGAREALLGRRLATWLTPASVDRLQTQLEQLRSGGAPQSCELQQMPKAGPSVTLMAIADRDTTPERYLLVLMAPVPAK